MSERDIDEVFMRLMPESQSMRMALTEILFAADAKALVVAEALALMLIDISTSAIKAAETQDGAPYAGFEAVESIPDTVLLLRKAADNFHVAYMRGKN